MFAFSATEFVMRRNSAHQREMSADDGADETYIGALQLGPSLSPSDTDVVVARRRRRLVLRHLSALFEPGRFIVAEH